MTSDADDDTDATLILAAEECPPDRFADFHSFSSYDEITIRKLIAHGPVLIRGGRGSGKSAMLIEVRRRLLDSETVFSVYVSLRYLPLLQSDGNEYIKHFCKLLSREIQAELQVRNISAEFPTSNDQESLQIGLTALSRALNMRVVLLFDDAAHIGREKPLEVFFDLFRTISSDVTSCKASIYPGVTKFGTRFDVYNDSTVVEISRSDVSRDPNFFPTVLKARYPQLAVEGRFSDRLSATEFANVVGRGVVGNMRGFILACNRFDAYSRIGFPQITSCFLEMASDYYWPLMEEVAPKLGLYEPLIEPAQTLIQAIFDHAVVPVKEGRRISAQDRVLIHRNYLAQFAKLFEILEYLGFLSRREASRALKSGGRGAVFALNLCNLLDNMPTRRLTSEISNEWISATMEPAEVHVASQVFHEVELPVLPDEQGLAILQKDISVLAKSSAYPYGLTEDKISRLQGAGIDTVGRLTATSDYDLKQIDRVGPSTVRRIRNVLYQAIWM